MRIKLPSKRRKALEPPPKPKNEMERRQDAEWRLRNDPHRPYQAYGAALTLWSTREEEVLIVGPAGTGKSRGALEKAHYCAMYYPNIRILIVRKTRESMTESVLVTYEEKVVQADHDCLRGPGRNIRQRYVYPNGSTIVVGGMDKSMKIMSTEYDMIICFEATELTEEDFEQLTTRLRNGRMPYHQIIADCNPSYPQHWLNQRALKGHMLRLNSRHEDNPTLYDVEEKRWKVEGAKYLARLDRLSGARFLRLRKGIWAAVEGAVYPMYDPEIHLIPGKVWKYKFSIKKSWRRIRVIDFGYTHPFVCQWWAIDEDGRMFMYREIYMTQRTVKKHAQVIKRLSRGETYEATICDHDAEDRATLEEEGIYSIPAYKDKQRGIQAVVERLQPAGDGKPRIAFLRDTLVERDIVRESQNKPIRTTDEPDGYVWDTVKHRSGENIKEEPVKVNDDGMDTTRYAVAYVDDLQAMNMDVQLEEPLVVSADDYDYSSSVIYDGGGSDDYDR